SAVRKPAPELKFSAHRATIPSANSFLLCAPFGRQRASYLSTRFPAQNPNPCSKETLVESSCVILQNLAALTGGGSVCHGRHAEPGRIYEPQLFRDEFRWPSLSGSCHQRHLCSHCSGH